MNENQLPPLSNIGKALLAAQREIEGVSKDSENPHFKSRFADLTSVIEATVPVLNRHGIVVIQLPTPGLEGTLSLTTMLLHAESGESISGTAVVPLAKQDPQAYGSAMTYARRYSLGAAVSLKFLDDDAEAAVGRAAPPPPPKGLNFGRKSNDLGGSRDAKTPADEPSGKGIDFSKLLKGKQSEPKADPPKRGKSGLFPKVGKSEEGSDDAQA